MKRETIMANSLSIQVNLLCERPVQASASIAALALQIAAFKRSRRDFKKQSCLSNGGRKVVGSGGRSFVRRGLFNAF
jgi:hypothetical protein